MFPAGSRAAVTATTGDAMRSSIEYRGSTTCRGERGAVLAEFAIAFPVLILLMMGVIDLGLTFSHKGATTNAAREAARVGSVGRVGDRDGCTIDGSPIDDRTRRLVCHAKARTGVADDDARVRITYMDGDGAHTTDFSDAALVANRYSLMVCISTRTRSVTGMLHPFLDGRFHHARAVIKTAATPWSKVVGGRTVYTYPPPFEERPMTGPHGDDTWTWCRSDDPSRDATP